MAFLGWGQLETPFSLLRRLDTLEESLSETGNEEEENEEQDKPWMDRTISTTNNKIGSEIFASKGKSFAESEGEGRRVQKWGGGGSGLSRVVARVCRN